MPAKVLLELKNVTIKFGGLTAVSDLSFKLFEGEIVGLIGPNGAGKTTVFNLISGVYRPTEGEIYLNGENITGLKPFQICHRGIGRTFQVVRPFGGKSVLYNVMVGAFLRTNDTRKSREKALEVLQLVGLYNKKDVLAKNLTIVDRKRLEVAKALATEPKLLLLDEVLAGLNPAEVDEAVEMIRQIHKSGITILLIEHVLKAAMALSQRIMVLDYGKKIAEGSPEEVTSNPEVIKAYLGDNYGIA
ncbi:branched-chain amino acid transport system ATP-binding protein [Desulfofundulus australicus DSM 11792]|uniref:Branched-chain amino acid transport system ATP-binding protein n=1 Tax=Desulfofundulus australicus DSM 11792 TaxID=1121425 RepID=A0A1M4SJM8_9FIRM|nr:ABC transporter ATP-binding protein [Desulfofundulus australicus]MDK2888218.1 branched-chain amino acid transport system ATP-binding protein [Thermoanaerobacter sp.]SHE32401.1 branched-chain amino acid transport system ATP-binding protein [Desulfofundulus australicus DSM 11792]